MRRLLFMAAMLPTVAGADPVKDIAGTTISLQDTQAPNAVAEVEFYNRRSNNVTHNQTFDLTHNGLTISVTFTWRIGEGYDSISVIVPKGYIAVPDLLELPEETTDTLLIYPDGAVGM